MRVGTIFSKLVTLNCSRDRAFSYLADIGTQARVHFPGVRSIEAVSGNEVRWQFEQINVKGLSIDIECFTTTEVKGDQILARAVSGRGNGSLSIIWGLKDKNGVCELRLDADFGVEVNIPFWLKPLAGPFAESELSKLFDRYLANVEKALQ